MKALYTEIFSDFLTRIGAGTEDEDPLWTAIKTKFEGFPEFEINDDLSFNMYDLFVDKYEIREIGAETDALFYHHLNDKLNEILIKYTPKIKIFLLNIAKSADRKIALDEDSDTSNYLYPVTSQSAKIATKVNFNGTREQGLYLFKSNAEVLNEVMNIRDIYLEALEAFQVCFMGIY